MRPRDENKLRAIKSKAVEMIAREGLEGFSINKLAKAAGVSPATLYIYFRDKEDLITSISVEEGKKMTEATLKDFDPGMPFADGLWLQWKNRADYMLNNRTGEAFWEQLKNSSYRDEMVATITESFKKSMGDFMKNAIRNKQVVDPMSLEVYWSVAFAPLYNLIRFHNEGKSIGNRRFVFSHKVMRQTFELVLKALTP